MLHDLVPSMVAVAEAFEDVDEASMFDEERAFVTRAVDKRRREFATSRHCARQALQRLGLPPTPILPGERGAPIWPVGIVGSMTHCDGYRAAALARRRDTLTVGIDAEPAGPLPDGVFDVITLAEERLMVRDLMATAPGPHWDRLLFCAKEAVYKAWFPLARTFLDFSEARVTFDPAARTFAAQLLVPGPVSAFTGRWLAARGLVLTAIVVSAG
jgi:4'-phosphopantetheinyl transferase EntD